MGALAYLRQINSAHDCRVPRTQRAFRRSSHEQIAGAQGAGSFSSSGSTPAGGLGAQAPDGMQCWALPTAASSQQFAEAAAADARLSMSAMADRNALTGADSLLQQPGPSCTAESTVSTAAPTAGGTLPDSCQSAAGRVGAAQREWRVKEALRPEPAAVAVKQQAAVTYHSLTLRMQDWEDTES